MAIDQLQINFTPEEKSMLRKQADREGISMTVLVRSLVAAYCDEADKDSSV